MMFDRPAGKSQVNMTLNDDLVRQARALTPNLSDTAEQLVADFVDRAVMQEAERQRLIDQHIEASNAFTAAHGCWADEFYTL
jgi:antitoxin CcdA